MSNTLKTPLWLKVTILMVISLFSSLSYWQLQRGLTKKAILSEINLSAQRPLVTQLSTNSQLPMIQPVSLQGFFDSKRSILLNSRWHEGKIGYHVLLPFRTLENQWIIVHCGWIENPDLVANHLPAHQVSIEGTLIEPKKNWFVWHNIAKNEWPLQALQIDLEDFSSRLGVSLFPRVVHLQSDSPWIFQAVNSSQTYLSPERHWGYAAQWGLFALITLGLYLYFHWKRRKQ